MIEANPQEKNISNTLGLDDAYAKHPMHKKRWFWYLLAAIAVSAAFFFFVDGQRPDQVQYQTKQVKRGDFLATVSATGTLAPVKEVEVGIEVSGTVKTVLVGNNDRVRVGQILAELDTRRFEAQAMQYESALESARAKVKQAEATLQEAQIKLNRLNQVKVLSGGKVPAPYDMDTAKATLGRAKADLASAKASVKQAQGTLNDYLIILIKAVVHSPINGVVLERSVEPGQTVASQFEAPVMFKLAEDLTKMKLQVDVDEADIGLVHEGQEATFTVDAYPDQAFPAKITQVRYGSQTVDGVVTYKTDLSVDNSDLSLRPGMTATAVITVNKKRDVLLIDNSVLSFTPPLVQDTPKNKGSFIDSLLPRPPNSDSGDKPKNPTANSKAQQVWALHNGALVAIAITKGITNGVVTEIVDGNIDIGTELVSGQVKQL